jgi:hypothetical protein
MIFVGIVFVCLIIVVLCVVNDETDRFGLVFTLLILGGASLVATQVVKTEATNDAVHLYKRGLLKETITIKQTTEYGKIKVDTVYNYSRL